MLNGYLNAGHNLINNVSKLVILETLEVIGQGNDCVKRGGGGPLKIVLRGNIVGNSDSKAWLWGMVG